LDLALLPQGEKLISNLGTDYNPASVMLKSNGSGPYIGAIGASAGANTGGSFNRIPGMPPVNGGTGTFPGSTPNPNPAPSPGSGNYATLPAKVPQISQLTPESVRASGTGPFDDAYRQNLATYAGGQFQRPGGNLSFNPTSSNLFGNPTGGGNDPVLGMGNSLLSMGLGGQPAAFNTTPQTQTANTNPTMGGNQLGGSLLDWLRQLRGNNGGANFAGLQT
jgi:hypothetical protein